MEWKMKVWKRMMKKNKGLLRKRDLGKKKNFLNSKWGLSNLKKNQVHKKDPININNNNRDNQYSK